ncbi:MAG: hypothetical protein GY719_00430 [bacterium]|nr:hypothetical protein [bacterium]
MAGSFYALGEDAVGCSDPLDLEDPKYGVFWFDRQHVDVEEDQRSDEKLGAWIGRQIEDSRGDLEADGIDPDGTPEEKRAIEEENRKGCCLALLVIALVGGLLCAAVVVAWDLLIGG